MFKYGLLILLLKSLECSKFCDHLGVLLYENLNCNLENKTNGCPSNYKCKGLEPSETECFYKGNSYPVGTQVPSQLAPACHFGCSCLPRTKNTAFGCPHVDCPPNHYNFKPTNSTCYQANELNQCCSFEKCMKTPYTCEFEGKTYKENQLMFPRNSCHRCVCKEGFTGALEAPFCERINCAPQLTDQEMIQNKCAPLYENYYLRNDGIFCCPKEWICATGSEQLQGNIEDPNKMCQFGSTTLKLGQYFVTTIEKYSRSTNIKCDCSVPPLIKCIKLN